MAEYPNTKPPEDLTWASTGRTADPADRRAEGWIDGQQPPLEEWNFLAHGHERYISHQEGRIWRQFDDLTEAIDTLDPGEVFYFRPPTSKWVDVDTKPTQTPASAIDWITTDGRRVYYIQAGILIGATARPNGSVEAEWGRVLASEGMTGVVTGLDTDGVIVVVTAIPGTTRMMVVNAVTGVVIESVPFTSISNAIAPTCYSTGGTPRIYFHENGVLIREWTQSGITTLHTLETVGQVLAAAIEPAGDRLWFITTDLTPDENYIIYIPIGGGSEVLVDTRTETTSSQAFGSLDYDDYYQLMYAATRSNGAVGTDLSLVFNRNGSELYSVDGETGPWSVSSKYVFGVGQPYGNAALIAYRDLFELRSFGDVFNGASLNLTTLRTVGSRYRWYADNVVDLVTLGIVNQPSLWRIRDDVQSGPNRRIIAQPLGVTYG